jgi:hypothetical protein
MTFDWLLELNGLDVKRQIKVSERVGIFEHLFKNFLWLNGVAETLTVNDGPIDRLDFDTIGGRPDIDNLSLDGYIGEVLDYSRALDATEREEVEEYLMLRWGIS